MRTLRRFQVMLAVLSALTITACSGPLPKSRDLLEAERAYTEARSDPAVLEYAGPQLNKANATLKNAAKAENKENMDSLAYVANTQVETAIQLTETAEATKKFKALSREKEILVAQSLKLQNSKLEQQLSELQARETDRGLMYSLGDVLFVYGKADLLPGAVEPINQLADFMKKHPDKTMLIEGHTDSTGSASFNKKLSLQRAEYVKTALMQRSIAESRMKAIGLGQSQPVATNTTEAGRRKNRRVEVIIQD